MRRRHPFAHAAPLTPAAGEDASAIAALKARTGDRYVVVAELDARGAIDRHAAMCLRFTIEDLLARGVAEIVIDLRDLTVLSDHALDRLTAAQRECAAAGAHLGLLLDPGFAHSPQVRALQHRGLGVNEDMTARRLSLKPSGRASPRLRAHHAWRNGR